MPIKSVPIQLDKRRNLRFDLNAFCVLEDEFGISIMQLFETLGVPSGKKIENGEIEKKAKNIKLKDMRVVIWAALIHEDPKLKLEDVGKYIDLNNFPEIMTKVVQALVGAFETSETEEDSKNETRSEPT